MFGEPNNIRSLLFAILMVATSFAAATGNVIYVDDDAAGANDGSSWADAYVFLQDALDAAGATEKPVEVRVAGGTYRPDQGATVTAGRASASFGLVDGVTLRGGFAGAGAVDTDARDVEAFETILSGDLDGDDVDVNTPQDLQGEITRTENSWWIVEVIDSDATTLIDGLVIVAGKEGIRKFVSGDLSVSNCTFRGNSRSAIHNSRGDLTITDCVFESNWRHTVDHRGGNMTLTGCLFAGNWGSWGVGIYSHAHSGEVTLRDCTFVDNVATGHTAAVDCNVDKLGLYNCEFRGNVAGRTACVDAWVHEDFVAEDCVFTGNMGQAIRHTVGRMILSNCVIAGNRGQAVESHGRYMTIRNCTISDNVADDGNAVLDTWHRLRITNSILWGNSTLLVDTLHEEPAMTYCNVEGGWPGEGNIDVDPGFVAPGYWDLNGTPDDPNDDLWVDGDYHLLSQAGRWDPGSESWVQDETTSPCIDAGDPNGPLGLEPFPNGGIANMGAYGGIDEAGKSYFGGPTCEVILAGDINGDCVVDFDDLAILMSQWMMRGEDFVNKPPVVTLIEPQDGDEITWPGPTTFRAEAYDPDGEVERVSFNMEHKHDGGTRGIGFSASEAAGGWEREYDWQSNNELPQGTWTVWAEVTDNEG
ncbi:MAG: right-handed parallel beta-helix repeat-containing protein, partial [Planctomycetota bacterium]